MWRVDAAYVGRAVAERRAGLCYWGAIMLVFVRGVVADRNACVPSKIFHLIFWVHQWIPAYDLITALLPRAAALPRNQCDIGKSVIAPNTSAVKLAKCIASDKTFLRACQLQLDLAPKT